MAIAQPLGIPGPQIQIRDFAQLPARRLPHPEFRQSAAVTIRKEREIAPVGRPGRAPVAAFPAGEVFHLARGDIDQTEIDPKGGHGHAGTRPLFRRGGDELAIVLQGIDQPFPVGGELQRAKLSEGVGAQRLFHGQGSWLRRFGPSRQ